MSLPLQTSQTLIEAGITTTHASNNNTPFKFFDSTFLERKVENASYYYTN